MRKIESKSNQIIIIRLTVDASQQLVSEWRAKSTVTFIEVAEKIENTSSQCE